MLGAIGYRAVSVAQIVSATRSANIALGKSVRTGDKINRKGTKDTKKGIVRIEARSAILAI